MPNTRCLLFFSDILKTFLNATPNIEELHIGYSNDSALDSFCPDASDSDASDSDGPDPWTPTDYKSSVYIKRADCLKMIGLRCNRLTTLSLSAFCLFEGDFFETVCTLFIHVFLCTNLCIRIHYFRYSVAVRNLEIFTYVVVLDTPSALTIFVDPYLWLKSYETLSNHIVWFPRNIDFNKNFIFK